LFQRRILGLTSYYRSAQEQLLPNFVPVEDEDNDVVPNSSGGRRPPTELVVGGVNAPRPKPILHVVFSEMSDYQFENYSKIRKEERDQEKKSKKNAKRAKPGAEELYTISSTYRIFSRASCNFVFPKPPGRPMPERQVDSETDISEAILDATPARLLRDADPYDEGDDEEEENDETQLITKKKDDEGDEPKTYADRIIYALKYLQDHSDEYLSSEGLKTYSPKFLNILENLTDAENVGLHLIYSQFRTIEGIGILKLILEANGF
jgi:hypothetical protein